MAPLNSALGISMKVARILLVLLLTLFWVTLSLVFFLSSATFIPIAVVTAIYGLLVYLVWPIGTSFSEVAAKRLFIVLGAGVFLVALNIVLTEDCPKYPTYLWLMYPKQSLFAAMTTLTCTYLGKYPASIILVGVGCYLIYLGLTLRPNPSVERDAPTARPSP
jgi:hypothetical protein